jgi:toxin-antitoxin system PIN domain toxin
VILVDANLLIYAYDSASAHHEVARGWLETTFSGSEQIGLTWMVVLAFVRISTSPRPLEHPFSIAEAAAVVSAWLAQPAVALVHPGERHWEILRRLLEEGQAPGPLVMDAHLAALAIEHGATLATTDKDFTRFPGLRVFNPLVPSEAE